MFLRTFSCVAAFATLQALLGSVAVAQQNSSPNRIQKVGKYAVDLRMPTGGLYAGEETDVEFRVTDTSQDDPVQGAPPVVNAKVTAEVTMPSMPGMPAQKPKIHSEGVPGDYGVVLFFPHGGDFQVALSIQPPGGQPFVATFKVPVGDAVPAGKRKAVPLPFSLSVTSSPAVPKAGEPAVLTIVVQSRDTNQPVTDFDTVHERSIHFIVVSRDLSHFAHEHPVLGEGGKFTLHYTFPTGGEYRLFADVAPKGAGSIVLMQPMKVTGPAPAEGSALTTAKPSTVTTVDGMQVALKTDLSVVRAGRTLPLTFAVTDGGSGAPVTDIQPWLGAVAHLILIQEDGSTFVHSHPDESDPNNGKTGAITFNAQFPKPGPYRGWLQFQRAGIVHTAAFILTAGGAFNSLGGAK